MEDARRIITRLTKKRDAAENEPGRDETASPTTPERRQNVDETGAEEDPTFCLRARAAATPRRARNAQTKLATPLRRGRRFNASDPVEDREGSIRKPTRTARRPTWRLRGFRASRLKRRRKRSEISKSEISKDEDFERRLRRRRRRTVDGEPSNRRPDGDARASEELPSLPSFPRLPSSRVEIMPSIEHPHIVRFHKVSTLKKSF